MKTIVLVACTKNKAQALHSAKNLYSSELPLKHKGIGQQMHWLMLQNIELSRRLA